MGRDIVSVSRVQRWTPDLGKLTDLGLSGSRHVIDIEPEEVEQGLWSGLEAGAYWSGPGTEERSDQIGSYTYYGRWREACWEIGPGPALKELLVHSDFNGGWGAEPAAELHRELSTRRAEALGTWALTRDKGSVDNLIETWDLFLAITKRAADEGLMMLC